MDGRLPHAVRAVGEQIRRINSAIHKANVDAAMLASVKSDVVRLLFEHRQDELLTLRALQAELFLQAVHESLHKRKPTTDLIELGGEFPKLLFESWVTEDGRSILDDDTLRLMFRTHFARLTGLEDHPLFRQSLEEIRRYYGILIEYPPVFTPSEKPRDLLRLKYARALQKADPTFDARPLLGMLYLRVDQPGHAVKLFDEFLAERKDAAFSHAVRGHLKLALLRAAQMARGSFGP